jgi:CheY-like chemotaxis protein
MEGAPTILVVDDSEVSRETVQGFFSKAGCVVIAAESAEAAWSVLTSGRPVDLVILDWHLPNGMSGPALNRRIMSNERFKNIPVVAFTSKLSPHLGSPESREWVASFMGDEGATLRVRDNYREVAKLNGDSDAMHIPPELVISAAERLKDIGKTLPKGLEDAANSLRMQRSV